MNTHEVSEQGCAVLETIAKAPGFNRWVFEQFEPWLGDEILEAGCGIGTLTALLADRGRVVGIDLDSAYIERLKNAYAGQDNLRFLAADLSKQGDMATVAAEGPFDSVMCVNVLEHIEDDLATLDRFRRLLKPGGHCIILVPNNPGLFCAMDEAIGHYRRYSEQQLRARLEEAGFEVAHSHRFNRVGAVGWRVFGKMLGRKAVSGNQMTLFEWGLPLVKLAEHVPFHCHNSVIGIGRLPAA